MKDSQNPDDNLANPIETYDPYKIRSEYTEPFAMSAINEKKNCGTDNLHKKNSVNDYRAVLTSAATL